MVAADILDGRKGEDQLSGGDGADRFVFVGGDGHDRITDFSVAEDELRLNSDLWGSGLTAQQVVDQYAKLHHGNVVFDFGNDELTLRHVSSDDGIAAQIVLT